MRWVEQCEALYKAQGEEAALDTLEPVLKVTIRPLDRLGHFTMRVEITPDHLTQAHSFEFEIDQTYLPDITRQFRAIASVFPIRGEGRRGPRQPSTIERNKPAQHRGMRKQISLSWRGRFSHPAFCRI